MIDLYDPNFLHGTERGYSDGCHGKQQCTMYGTDFLTCMEVHGARASDYNLRKTPELDRIRRDQVGPIAAATPPPNVQRREPPFPTADPDPMPGVNAAEIPAKDDHDATLTAPVAPAPGIDTTPATTEEKPKRLPPGLTLDDPLFPHGTVAGFVRGCKTPDGCPAGRDGNTCRQANRDYQRDYAARRAQNGGTKLTDQAPTTPPPALIDAELPPETTKYEDPANYALEYYPEPTVAAAAPAPVEPTIATLENPNTDAVLRETISQLRRELTNADRATNELTKQHRLKLEEIQGTLASAGARVDLAETARDQARTEVERLERINTDLTHRVGELEAEQTARTAAVTPERSQELIAASPAALQPTGGATPAAQLGLTINPTDHAGVSLGFTLPGSGEQLAIRIALSASDKPGLGDVAISVGSN